jgi:Trk K+ transport system NAD-binding subunit
MSSNPSGLAVLVCGLGRVGRQCIQALRGYNVPVRAIDLRDVREFAPELAALQVTQGDVRELSTLVRAGIGECRSIILATSDANVNVEGALAARRANASVRLVVRAQELDWHQLLALQLGNMVVYEPNRLAAPTFALAAIDSEVLAHFYVDSHLFQVLEHVVGPNDPWVGSTIDALHPPGRQILSHIPAAGLGSEGGPFYGWEPQNVLAAGDRLLLLQSGGRDLSAREVASARSLRSTLLETVERVRHARLQRPATLTLFGVGVLSALILFATSMFSYEALRLPPMEALRFAISLLFGGHLADLVESYEELPPSVHWLELVLVIAGTLLTAVLYALLTDLLLRARFNLRSRRPRVPLHDHVIVAGLGQTGVRIAGLLEQLHYKVAAIEANEVESHVLPDIPVVRGNPAERATLQEAWLSNARGIVAATSEDQTNVEIALVASTVNPRCRIAVRTFDPRFRENIAFLLPRARVLCVSTLAATAYAAAALGEHVIHLFQTPQAPVLVVEYDVTVGDTLIDKPLWQVAEGYAVVPVIHGRAGQPASIPGRDDTTHKLCAGDRLVVLATAASLEAIERGELQPPRFQLRLVRMHAYAEPIELVGMLNHRLGYTLEHGYEALAQLPHVVPLHLYARYAARTARLLDNSGLSTEVIRVRDSA